MKNIFILNSLLILLFSTTTAQAISIMIGDVDGFGIPAPNDYYSANDQFPDTNGNGYIEPGEFIPDFDNDGKVHVQGHDEFDNRSEAETSAVTGAQWTDISLESYFQGYNRFPADGVEFLFTFSVPEEGDADFGIDHFINFVFADYDVTPASLEVDGTSVSLTKQSNNSGQDGLVQLAYAVIPWEEMLDGQVTVDLMARKEPYMAIDYAFLNTVAGPGTPTDPVPEPATMLLFGAGLAGLAGSRLRKIRK